MSYCLWSNHDIYNANRYNKLKFKDEEWSDISKEAISLVTIMLDKNTNTRPSSYECLNYVWFKLCEGKQFLQTTKQVTWVNGEVRSTEQVQTGSASVYINGV